ncbi:MAG TPA: hypothetical protein VJ901_15945 [Thermoanaerobaculia bacterium]|nr:hypothetical protein [Thermoanaerobaculia bacterium]
MSANRRASVNPILSLLASSAGASGLVVIVGFFIQQGIRSIIGVSARRAADITVYFIDSAYFLEDTLGSLFDHAKEIFIGLLCVARVIWVVSRFVRPRPPRFLDYARNDVA